MISKDILSNLTKFQRLNRRQFNLLFTKYGEYCSEGLFSTNNRFVDTNIIDTVLEDRDDVYDTWTLVDDNANKLTDEQIIKVIDLDLYGQVDSLTSNLLISRTKQVGDSVIDNLVAIKDSIYGDDISYVGSIYIDILINFINIGNDFLTNEQLGRLREVKLQMQKRIDDYADEGLE